MSEDCATRYLGTVFDGKSEESLAIAARYSAREAEEKARSDGRIVVYSLSPGPTLLTPRIQDALLRAARPQDVRVRGSGEWVKNLTRRYSLRRREFMKDGYGRARFMNYVPSDSFFKILDRRGAFAALEVHDVIAFLDHLEQECIGARDVSFGLVNERAVPVGTLAWMKARDSIMTLGDSLTLTARKTEQLPLILLDSERRPDLDQAHTLLQSLGKALLFDPADPTAVEKQFDGFRKRAENGALVRPAEFPS